MGEQGESNSSAVRTEEVFTRAVTGHDLVNPFEAEYQSLKSRAPSQLLSHEKVRLNKLTSFNSLFQSVQPVYKSAAIKGNWSVAATVATKVAHAAQAIAMGIFLLGILVVSGWSQQTLPSQTKDQPTTDNLEYLDQQLRAAQSQLITLQQATVSSYTLPTSTFMYSSDFSPFPSASVFNVCVGTVSLTTSGGRVHIRLSGGFATTTGNPEVGISLFQDGAPLSPYTQGNNSSITAGVYSFQQEAASAAPNVNNMSFYIITRTAPSAGTHSWCIAPWYASGVASWAVSILSAQELN